jgi:hypothetical protein
MKIIHVLTIATISFIVAIGSVFILGRNNEVEKVAETVIQVETGQLFDLTPEAK